MKNTPFQPPLSDVQGASPVPANRWALAVRLVILACSGVPTFVLLANSSLIFQSMRWGDISPFSVLMISFFAFLLLLGGVLVLCKRKSALWAYAGYFPYQVLSLINAKSKTEAVYLLIALGFAAACMLYCVLMKRAGQFL